MPLSIATAVTMLAATAAHAPFATSRRRSVAPALARKVIRAATIRIASNPSRNISTKDSMNRLALDILSTTTRSARSSADRRRA
jgi:hypothetical protein